MTWHRMLSAGYHHVTEYFFGGICRVGCSGHEHHLNWTYLHVSPAIYSVWRSSIGMLMYLLDACLSGVNRCFLFGARALLASDASFRTVVDM